MFRVKHFSTKRSITKHRKHIFFNRNAFLRSCMTGRLRHFSAQNVKNNFEKDEMTITKSHFQTIEKQNLISNRSPTATSCNKQTHTQHTSINLEYKSAIDDCNRQQVKTKRTPAYGKIKVDKLFRKPFWTKISHLAVQFDGEKRQIHTKPTFHRILKFH